MKKTTIIILVFVVSMLTTGLSYYFYQKGLENGQKRGYELGQKVEREYYVNNETKLAECISEAENKRKKRWQGQCKALGEELDENGFCLIPKGPAEHYDSEYNNDRDFCLKLYK